MSDEFNNTHLIRSSCVVLTNTFLSWCLLSLSLSLSLSPLLPLLLPLPLPLPSVTQPYTPTQHTYIRNFQISHNTLLPCAFTRSIVSRGPTKNISILRKRINIYTHPPPPPAYPQVDTQTAGSLSKWLKFNLYNRGLGVYTYLLAGYRHRRLA